MTKYTIAYQRKVQVRQYEMLDIGLTQEFETNVTPKNEAYIMVSHQVDIWIGEALKRL